MLPPDTIWDRGLNQVSDVGREDEDGMLPCGTDIMGGRDKKYHILQLRTLVPTLKMMFEPKDKMSLFILSMVVSHGNSDVL